MDSFVSEVIDTADGRGIAARFFTPRGSPRAAVLIVPAMGASQSYYADFAAWLASRDFLVATFDYRGIGLSREGSLRGFDVTILDWAEVDCAALVDAVVARAPGLPLYWVGHSLGSQILPFVPNRERVTKMISVAAGSGYWRENAWKLRRSVWWLWYVVAPLSMRCCGYFPGKRLRIVGDLPRGVMEQWRRWCLDSEYAPGAEGDRARRLYASLDLPIVTFSFTDDEYMSARNIESFHGFFEEASLKSKRLAPEDIGVARIGHFGFFRSSFRRSLWEELLLPELSP